MTDPPAAANDPPPAATPTDAKPTDAAPAQVIPPRPVRRAGRRRLGLGRLGRVGDRVGVGRGAVSTLGRRGDYAQLPSDAGPLGLGLRRRLHGILGAVAPPLTATDQLNHFCWEGRRNAACRNRSGNNSDWLDWSWSDGLQHVRTFDGGGLLDDRLHSQSRQGRTATRQGSARGRCPPRRSPSKATSSSDRRFSLRRAERHARRERRLGR